MPGLKNKFGLGSKREDGSSAADAFNDMPLLATSDAHSLVEIHLRADGLVKMDTFSKSDPFARLVVVGDGGLETEIGRTEVIQDTQRPKWAQGIKLDYHFEESQTLRVEVWDNDKPGSLNLKDHELQGIAMFTMAELMTSDSTTVRKTLYKGKSAFKAEKVRVRVPATARAGDVLGARTKGGEDVKVTVPPNTKPGAVLVVKAPPTPGGKPAGTVTISGEELQACSEFLSLGLSGKHLANKDGFFSKSDPYYELHKAREDGTWIPVYRSVFLKNTLNPSWPVAKKISLQSLCNGDYDRPLRIEVFDMDDDGSHDDMGRVETSVRQLLEQGQVPVTQQKGMPCMEDVKKTGKKKQSGSLYVDSSGITRYDTFLDYIKGGWELNMMLGIDFTGSNGSPANPDSLHYRSPVPNGSANQYEQAIMSLGEVITEYDHDQLYPAYGFGGRQPNAPVSHCFALNGYLADPAVRGVDGILEAYATALTQWGLSGPTIFAQMIQAAGKLAEGAMFEANLNGSSGAYTILLILTDGEISDMEATKEAIVAVSGLPLSIIIIGVGDADFDKMVELDGDDERLTDQHGRRAKRDIVQFVKFNDFTKAAAGMLAKETLLELPGQMLGYFKDNHVKPRGKPKTTKMHLKTDGERAAAAAMGSSGAASPTSASATDNSVPLSGDVEPFVRGKPLKQDPSLMNVTVPPGVKGGQQVLVDTPGGIELAIQIPFEAQPGDVIQVHVPPQCPSQDLGSAGRGLLQRSMSKTNGTGDASGASAPPPPPPPPPASAANWQAHTSADGQTYYHDTVSGTTSWAKPPGF